MIEYTPGIHGFTPMRSTTEKALQRLWDHNPENPYLSICFTLNTKIGSSISAGVPEVIFANPTTADYKSLILEDAVDELDCDILSAAVLAALSDRWITEFPEDFQRQTTAIDFEYHCLTVHVFPGCLMLQNIDPATFVEEKVQDDWGPDYVELWNLGAFAAGPIETAHEQISAISAVEAARPAWQTHLQTINEAAPERLRILSPKIHPNREGYCDP